jgi:hypothetical protein
MNPGMDHATTNSEYAAMTMKSATNPVLPGKMPEATAPSAALIATMETMPSIQSHVLTENNRPSGWSHPLSS